VSLYPPQAGYLRTPKRTASSAISSVPASRKSGAELVVRRHTTTDKGR